MFIVMGVLMGPVYTTIEDSVTDVAADFPEEVLTIIGGADLGTPEGWFQSETFSFMAPAMVIYAVVVGGAIFSCVTIASAISGLGMSTAGIAAASLLVTLLGLMFGTLALAVSAATGKVKAAVYIPIGIALTSY